MTAAEKFTWSAYDTLPRLDFVSFARSCFRELSPRTQFAMNWHIEIIATKLMALRTGKIRRLIINLPPRYLKSLLASIAFPDWRRGEVQVFGICAALPVQLCDPLRLTRLSMTIVFPCAIRRTVIDSDRHLGRRQRHDSAVLSQELSYGQSVPDIDKQVGRQPGIIGCCRKLAQQRGRPGAFEHLPKLGTFLGSLLSASGNDPIEITHQRAAYLRF